MSLTAFLAQHCQTKYNTWATYSDMIRRRALKSSLKLKFVDSESCFFLTGIEPRTFLKVFSTATLQKAHGLITVFLSSLTFNPLSPCTFISNQRIKQMKHIKRKPFTLTSSLLLRKLERTFPGFSGAPCRADRSRWRHWCKKSLSGNGGARLFFLVCASWVGNKVCL